MTDSKASDAIDALAEQTMGMGVTDSTDAAADGTTKDESQGISPDDGEQPKGSFRLFVGDLSRATTEVNSPSAIEHELNLRTFTALWLVVSR